MCIPHTRMKHVMQYKGGPPMRNIDFTDLRENFDSVCNTVNNGKEAVTLTLKSNRKVYIMPEENYDSIQRFIIPAVSTINLASR